MTNPMMNAPWWDMLFEIVALPAINVLLPFMLVGILAAAYFVLRSIFHRRVSRLPATK